MADLLRRHIMMQAGGSTPYPGWEFGVRYSSMNSTNTTIVSDPDYCMSPYIPVSVSNVDIFFNGASNGVMREFAGNNCIDYWPDSGYEVGRNINLNSNTTQIRICTKISVLDSSFVLYLHASDPTQSYFLFQGIDAMPIFGNNVINYYKYTESRPSSTLPTFTRDLSISVIYPALQLDTSVPNFNVVGFYVGMMYKTLFEYNSNGQYIDYWGSQTGERVVTLHTNARYVLMTMDRLLSVNSYIKYNSTQEYIWKGDNV